jgi:uncharacterized protein (TIGR00251 family)
MKVSVRVVPNSNLDKICGFTYDNKLRIKLKVKPQKGLANKYLIKYLSKKYRISRSDIIILNGMFSRNKLIEFSNISEDEFLKKTEELVMQNHK